MALSAIGASFPVSSTTLQVKIKAPPSVNPFQAPIPTAPTIATGALNSPGITQNYPPLKDGQDQSVSANSTGGVNQYYDVVYVAKDNTWVPILETTLQVGP